MITTRQLIAARTRRIVRLVGMLETLDSLPAAIAQPAGRLWNVFTRSLGEQGADGRTALAWRWALGGDCPAPVTLAAPPGQPPERQALLAEADAPAELGHPGTDPGGQVLHARFVLRWLVGDLDALPLWNGGSDQGNVTDGAGHPRPRDEIEQAFSWATLARWHNPWHGRSATAEAKRACGWAYGAEQLLSWACGEARAGPLTSVRVVGRPTLYQVALDNRRARTALEHVRMENDPVAIGRMEAMMATFLWLAGWDRFTPVDRHGHVAIVDCSERETLCDCDQAENCLREGCAACRNAPCLQGFGQDGFPAASAGPG